jgi:hypothetical protein
MGTLGLAKINFMLRGTKRMTHFYLAFVYIVMHLFIETIQTLKSKKSTILITNHF